MVSILQMAVYNKKNKSLLINSLFQNKSPSNMVLQKNISNLGHEDRVDIRSGSDTQNPHNAYIGSINITCTERVNGF